MREARLGELGLEVIGEHADQFQHLCLLGGVHLRERQPHGIQRPCTGSVAADDVTKGSRVEDRARPLRRGEAREPLTGQVLLAAEQPKARARCTATHVARHHGRVRTEKLRQRRHIAVALEAEVQ